MLTHVPAVTLQIWWRPGSNLSGAQGPIVYIAPSRRGAQEEKWAKDRLGALREQMGVAAHPPLAPPLQGCAEHMAKAAFPVHQSQSEG